MTITTTIIAHSEIDASLFICRITGEVVKPIDTHLVQVGGATFAWFHCPACDCNEHTDGDDEYDPAHPGPHLIDLTPPSTTVDPCTCHQPPMTQVRRRRTTERNAA